MRYYENLQRGTYFGTGYNATSMEELIDDFRSYIEGAGEMEDPEYYKTWPQIADSLDGVILQESFEPFEDLD